MIRVETPTVPAWDVATERSTVAQQAELATWIAGFAREDGFNPTAIQELSLYRSSRPTECIHTVLRPAFCLAAQGGKQLMVGDEIVAYDPAHYVVLSVDLPLGGRVIEASPEAPYLGLLLDLDPGQIGPLIVEAGVVPPVDHGPSRRAFYVSRSSRGLLDAAIRLVRLLGRPRDIPVLSPMIQREILYRLLTDEPGGQLHQIGVAGSQAQRIRHAVRWLQWNYAKPLRIEEMARTVSMSPSGLHHSFKAVIGMSPLQYQKRLRLQEARRLMLAEVTDAATAGYRVGYESPSQFSREYSRLFGAPPARDVARLRNGAEALRWGAPRHGDFGPIP